MALQNDFLVLVSVCTGGLVMVAIALVIGWNLGYAIRGLLKFFGRINEEKPPS